MVPASFVNVVRMTKRSIKLGEKQSKSDQELKKTQRELQISSGTDLESQHLALSKVKNARSCRQQFEGVEEQLDFGP